MDSDDIDKQLSISDEEELMFAFRGAGNSFGIITRIVYQVGRSLENSLSFVLGENVKNCFKQASFEPTTIHIYSLLKSIMNLSLQ